MEVVTGLIGFVLFVGLVSVTLFVLGSVLVKPGKGDDDDQ